MDTLYVPKSIVISKLFLSILVTSYPLILPSTETLKPVGVVPVAGCSTTVLLFAASAVTGSMHSTIISASVSASDFFILSPFFLML